MFENWFSMKILFIQCLFASWEQLSAVATGDKPNCSEGIYY